MCGITGYWDFRKRYTQAESIAITNKMTLSMQHRGPDGYHSFAEANDGIALGHSRLSIIDLSDAGKQPMESLCGNYIISYNGEIYNFRELKSELEQLGYKFSSHSDTLIMLTTISHYGIEVALAKFVGMFAFALWDRKNKSLTLVRDRFGIKPLYWGIINNTLLFGSELKALVQHPLWHGQINHSAIADFLTYNYIPTPNCIFKNIYKLKPGTIVNVYGEEKIEEKFYYDSKSILSNIATKNPSKKDLSSNIEELKYIINDAVGLRMLADVPLGAFLSGGIDSSLVAASMQSQASKPINTFSIGFFEEGYDEAPFAKKIAQHLGTNHHELYLTPKEAINVVPEMATMYDEPFADSSQIPTYLVSKLAKTKVTVALSGDGGDESFAGYNRYFLGHKLWHRFNFLPPKLKNITHDIITLISIKNWDLLSKLIPRKKRPNLLGCKAHLFAQVLKANSVTELYQKIVRVWPQGVTSKMHNAISNKAMFNSWNNNNLDEIAKMQLIDTLLYLPDDILTKVDRASMACSLEARVPLLDHRVVEYAWSLPLKHKIYNNQGKYILKQLLQQYVPDKLFNRPKMGFGLPIGKWLTTELKPWATDLLKTSAQTPIPLINDKFIQKKWQQHLNANNDYKDSLWGTLVLYAWFDKWKMHIHTI